METRRNRLVRAVVTLALTGAVSGILPSSVQAINRVGDRECSRSQWEFLELFNGLKFCFANKGDTRVLIANVTSGSSGNNVGYLETNKGRVKFTRGVFINMNGPTTVTRIVIY